ILGALPVTYQGVKDRSEASEEAGYPDQDQKQVNKIDWLSSYCPLPGPRALAVPILIARQDLPQLGAPRPGNVLASSRGGRQPELSQAPSCSVLAPQSIVRHRPARSPPPTPLPRRPPPRPI